MRKKHLVFGFMLPLALGFCKDMGSTDTKQAIFIETAKDRSCQIYQLTLKNGDQILVNFFDRYISVNDGKIKRIIPTNAIQEVFFNGVLQGSLKEKNGKIVNLGLNFVEDSHVTVKILNTHELIKFPWYNIDSIEAVVKEEDDQSPKQNPEALVFRKSSEPILVNQKIEIPEIDFIKQSRQVLQQLENFEIQEIEFQVAAEALLEETGEFEIPEVDFISEEDKSKKKKSHLLGMSREDVISLAKDIVGKRKKRKQSENISEKKIPEIQKSTNDLDLPSEERETSVLFETPMIIDFQSNERDIVEVKSPSTTKDVYDTPFANEKFENISISPRKVTNREYQQFIVAVGYKPPLYWKSGRIPFGLENHPVVNITYKDILLYSVWARKRVATYEELQLAQKVPGLLLDLDDGLNEWTSTPIGSSLGNEATISAKLGGSYTNGYLTTRGNPMYNGESNSLTGFRVVTDN